MYQHYSQNLKIYQNYSHNLKIHQNYSHNLYKKFTKLTNYFSSNNPWTASFDVRRHNLNSVPDSSFCNKFSNKTEQVSQFIIHKSQLADDKNNNKKIKLFNQLLFFGNLWGISAFLIAHISRFCCFRCLLEIIWVSNLLFTTAEIFGVVCINFV